MRRSKRFMLAVLSVLVLVVPMVGRGDTYVSGGTAVYKQHGEDPAVDTGVVVCDPEAMTGIGGACLPFGPQSPIGAFVDVADAVRGLAGEDPRALAFQVCIDNNGDGKCVSGGRDPGTFDPCADSVFFSHDDQGRFFNPLGPLPQVRVFPETCNRNGTGWNGYVVFLCEGVHEGKDGTTHAHPAATGTIRTAPQGPFPGQFGDFCGGIRDQVVKEYVVV